MWGGVATAAVFTTVSIYTMFRRDDADSALRAEIVAKNLRVPWSLSFISDDEALFTERYGSVKLLTLSSQRVELIRVFDVAAVGEGGLLGLETFKRAGKTMVYLYHTYSVGGRLYNRVVRLLYNGDLEDEKEIIAGIPGGTIHNGGRVKIGPDKMLYITTGEGGQPRLSQDLKSLGGKILRLTLEGEPPSDNPFKSPVYAYGLRNPQGVAWRKNVMYCTDHGPSGEGSRYAHDEVNIVVSGGNYGWPEVIGDEDRHGFIKPLIHSGLETWAPSGLCYYGSDALYLKDSLLFATLRGQHLHRLVLNDEGTRVLHSEKLFEGVFGRLRDVVEGPDGMLYILTSNRDGRGYPTSDDDRIIRLTSRI